MPRANATARRRTGVWGLGLVLLSPALWGQADRTQHSVLGEMAAIRAGAPSQVVSVPTPALYVLHCAGCHGLDGRGHPHANVPDLRQMPLLLGVAGGRAFVLRVPGVMGSGLSDPDIARLMNWIIQTYVPPQQARDIRPYVSEEVAQARAQPLLDVIETRRHLLSQAQGR